MGIPTSVFRDVSSNICTAFLRKGEMHKEQENQERKLQSSVFLEDPEKLSAKEKEIRN